MKPTGNPSEPTRTLELTEALDPRAAKSLLATLLELGGQDLAIDASKAPRLGASCLQVLLSAARAWKAEGHSLTLARASPRFIDDLRLLGFTPETFLKGAQPQ
jgi:chemotaxis protein CheX